MPEVKVSLLDPSIKVISINGKNPVTIEAEHRGATECPHCHSSRLRKKDRIERLIRHETIGLRICWLKLTLRKQHCLDCGRYFREQVRGLLPYKRSTEHFRRQVYVLHREGLSQSTLHDRVKIAPATVERWFHELLERKEREFSNRVCPVVMGVDEHYFSRKDGYVTTFADLRKGRVFELALGRSEPALRKALSRMKGRHRVRVICIDLSPTYRTIVQHYFPNARIVSDRFHVIRLLLQHFLESWKQLDPVGRKNRGLLSLMRRSSKKLSAEQKIRLEAYFTEHPAIGALYEAKEQLYELLVKKHQTKRACRPLVRDLLQWIFRLKESPLPAMQTLGRALDSWKKEIACMWRFTKNNGVTEGLHTKMEMIQRRAFGFRNFKNYRLRVIVLCG
jgi:transposase